jgi:hypothetical protein
MRQATGNRERRIALAVVAAILIVAGLVVFLWWQAVHAITNPGPPATGSGPCLQTDSIFIQLVFADGHSVQACTRDVPTCPNETISGTGPDGQTSSVSQFRLANDLRSAQRGYHLFIGFDTALPAEMGDQTLQLDPQVGLPALPGSTPAASGNPQKADVQITPRDPQSDGYTAVSGSLTVSAGGGVARGTVQGNFSPNAPAGSPARFVGAFVCKH